MRQKEKLLLLVLFVFLAFQPSSAKVKIYLCGDSTMQD